MTVPGSPLQQAAYQFRPMLVRDLAMVRTWQMAPHVQAWWDDDPITLASEDEPGTDQYIVAAEGRPFAYLQCYLQSAHPGNGLGTHPAGTRGIDQFIGEPEMIGRGHGSHFIRRFVDELLLSGTPRVVTDPDPENRRAVRAYEKAGFERDRVVDTPDGPALLMVRNRCNLSRSQSGLS
jgi:aminoglycoside 6'-N-acetyltransferase